MYMQMVYMVHAFLELVNYNRCGIGSYIIFSQLPIPKYMSRLDQLNPCFYLDSSYYIYQCYILFNVLHSKIILGIFAANAGGH